MPKSQVGIPGADPPQGTRRTRRGPCNPAAETLVAELEALSHLPKETLRERWKDLYGAPCPPRFSRRLLESAIAYRMQEHVLGGLDPATRRRFDHAARALAAGRTLTTPTPRFKPGTQLLREWQGTVHEVTVLERGVAYRGKTWPSLSAVAREITGARWSGPRFFGLKGDAGAQG